MKTVAFASALMFFAAPAWAQSTSNQSLSPRPSTDLTRMLNGASPTATTLPAPPRPPATSRPAASAPAAATPARVTPAPSATTPAAALAAPTVLNAAAIAALPFEIELPTGFQIVTGRPGPDFKVYTARRGGKPFVMIYAGPSSQFPIYDGDTVVVDGRASVVVSEGGQRRALEHLFEREDAPREIHVWVSSLEGADRAMGEQIAQSVDPR